MKKNEFLHWETEVVVQQFTSQELAKFKATDPDEVVSVRAGQAIELIEQYEQLSREYARVSADNVRLEEEIAEYKSNVAVLEQRISDLDRSSKLNSHNSNKPPSSDGLSKETVEKKKEKAQFANCVLVLCVIDEIVINSMTSGKIMEICPPVS